MNSPLLYDVTLRDGANANNQGFDSSFYDCYIDKAYDAGIRQIEVGHGYGLGGSSLHICRLQDPSIWDQVAIKARKYSDLRIGVHLIPGLATFDDIDFCIDHGISIFRVASHCTEADTTETYIKYIERRSLEVWGLLMMCHMAKPEGLVAEAKKLASYGASHVVFLDSAGALTPTAVQDISEKLVSAVEVPIGFHGHNNLSAAIANSLTALTAGCRTIDGSSGGYGPGAGNLSLESFVAILEKDGRKTGADIKKLMELAAYIEEEFGSSMPKVNSISTATGFHGLFSGFKPKILEAASAYGVSAFELIENLGRQQVIAGQEDQIIATAQLLSKTTDSCPPQQVF
jgi:4-hydroxy 2-oxovalerate aldolase